MLRKSPTKLSSTSSQLTSNHDDVSATHTILPGHMTLSHHVILNAADLRFNSLWPYRSFDQVTLVDFMTTNIIIDIDSDLG